MVWGSGHSNFRCWRASIGRCWMRCQTALAPLSVAPHELSSFTMDYRTALPARFWPCLITSPRRRRPAKQSTSRSRVRHPQQRCRPCLAQRGDNCGIYPDSVALAAHYVLLGQPIFTAYAQLLIGPKPFQPLREGSLRRFKKVRRLNVGRTMLTKGFN